MRNSAMQMHARELSRGSEVKPHQCQQCLKSFSSNHQLVQHIRVHTGEKPYKCSYCDRRFKQLSHVQQHTRLHTGQFLNIQYGFFHCWDIVFSWEILGQLCKFFNMGVIEGIEIFRKLNSQ